MYTVEPSKGTMVRALEDAARRRDGVTTGAGVGVVCGSLGFLRIIMILNKHHKLEKLFRPLKGQGIHSIITSLPLHEMLMGHYMYIHLEKEKNWLLPSRLKL